MEEVAVCSSDKESKLVRDTNSIRGRRPKCHSKVRGDGSQGPSTSSTRKRLRCCEEISSNQDSAFTSQVALAALEVAAVGDPSSQWMARGWKVHGKGNGSEIQESKSIRAG